MRDLFTDPRKRKAIYDLIGPVTLLLVPFGLITENQAVAVIGAVSSMVSALANILAGRNVDLPSKEA